jgi:predicted DNA-binding transcriptional regulator AlpA
MNSPPQLIRLPEVLRLTGLSRSTVYRLEKAGCFVPRVRLGDRLAEPSSHVNWSEDDLNLAPIGGAWVAADTLARPRRTPTCAGVPTDPNERRKLFPEMKETDHE